MSISLLQTARSGSFGLLLGLSALLLPGCSQQPDPASADDRSGPFGIKVPAEDREADAKEDESIPATREDAAATNYLRPSPEPPDGKWLVDPDGREYFIDLFPKNFGKVERLSEDKLRTPWGFVLTLAGEDDDYYHYKLYKPSGVPKPDYIPPSAEEIAEIEATFAVKTKTSNGLSFASFAEGLPLRGRWRNGFEIADMNGDGHLDIVHGPPRKGLSGPVIFLGDGQGNWRQWTEATFPRNYRYAYGDVAVADWNSDGVMDFAIASHLTGTVVLVGDGAGAFTAWTEGVDYDPPRSGHVGGFSSRAIIAVDWNRDEHPDLLALGEGPRLNRTRGEPTSSGGTFGPVIFLNRGDGTWGRHDQGTGWDQVFGDGIAVGDFNGDDLTDFASSTNMLSRRDIVFLGQADGTWAAEEVEEIRPWSYVRDIAVGDFDKNGRDDLAIGYLSYQAEEWRYGVDLFIRGSNGGWDRETLAAEKGKAGIYAMGSGDLNGDGALDLVGLTGVGDTWIFLGNGKGSFTREESLEIAQDAKRCRGYHVEMADLDDDGRDELVTAFSGEPSAVFDPDLCSNGGSLRAWDADSNRGGRKGE